MAHGLVWGLLASSCRIQHRDCRYHTAVLVLTFGVLSFSSKGSVSPIGA